MVQPKIEGTKQGKPVMPYGSDGTDWIAFLIDALGHLQIDVVESGLPSGGATEATLLTLATEAKLELVRLLLVSIDGKDFATQTTLNALLTELKLKADLTETQPISAASLPLPTGAATQTTLASTLTALQSIQNLVGALHDVGLDELDTIVKGFDPVPSTPVWVIATDIAIGDTSLTTLFTQNVTTNKTWYVTDFWFGPSVHTSAPAFMARLLIAGAEVWRRSYLAGYSDHVNLQTPRKATSGQAVELQIWQTSGGAVLFSGGFNGFEV